MPANNTKVQNQDINVIPVLDEITSTVSGTAKTLKDMGLDLAANDNVEAVEIKFTEDCYLRRFGGKPASSSNGEISAGRYFFGREEAEQVSFLNTLGASNFFIQAYKYTQI